jgi:hypothetical protein
MAKAIKEGRPILGQEIVVERPDGTRRCVLPYPDPIRDASGTVIGAVNMLLDLTERNRLEPEREQILLREQIARTETERRWRRVDYWQISLHSARRRTRCYFHNPISANECWRHRGFPW